MATYKEMLSRSKLQQHQHNFTYTQSSHVNGSNAIVEEKVKFLSKQERMNTPRVTEFNDLGNDRLMISKPREITTFLKISLLVKALVQYW